MRLARNLECGTTCVRWSIDNQQIDFSAGDNRVGKTSIRDDLAGRPYHAVALPSLLPRYDRGLLGVEVGQAHRHSMSGDRKQCPGQGRFSNPTLLGHERYD